MTKVDGAPAFPGDPAHGPACPAGPARSPRISFARTLLLIPGREITPSAISANVLDMVM